MPTSPANRASYRVLPNCLASCWVGDPIARTPERVRPSLRITFSSASGLNGKLIVPDASPVGEETTDTW